MMTNTLSTCTFLDCNEYRTDYDRQIDTTRRKRALGIQYKHESKEDIAGFISKTSSETRIRNDISTQRYVITKSSSQIFVHSY